MLKLKLDFGKLIHRGNASPGGCILTEKGRKHLEQMETDLEERVGKKEATRIREIIERIARGDP